MKKFIVTLILSFIISFLTAFIFNIFQNIEASASSSEIYTYEGVLSENYDSYNDLAVEDIEYVYFEGAPVYKMTIDFTKESFSGSYLEVIYYVSSGKGANSTKTYNSITLSTVFPYNNLLNLNIGIFARTKNTDAIRFYYSSTSSGKYYKRTVSLKQGYVYDLYFSSISITGTYDNLKFGEYGNSYYYQNYYYEDLDEIVDFNSDTNWGLDISHSYMRDNFAYELDDKSWSANTHISVKTFDIELFDSYQLLLASSDVINSMQVNFYTGTKQFDLFGFYDPNMFWFYKSDGTTDSAGLFLEILDVPNIVSFDVFYYFKEFYFCVKKPVDRVNNTLIFYNYDYDNFLSRMNFVKYQLRKNDDYYNVVYNGDVPNYKMMNINAVELQNIIFDEYIYVYTQFDDNLYYMQSGVSFVNNEKKTTLNLGFDFNFTYYTEPLVTNKNIYSYKFNKPSYVSMHFSLYPFYIPVLEMVENAIIFVVFYCPIISDIVSLVGLNYIIGGLLQLIIFLTDFAMPQLGTFIFGLFSFFVFMKFIQFLWPMAVNTGQGISSGIKTYHMNRVNRKIKRAKEKQKAIIIKSKIRGKIKSRNQVSSVNGLISNLSKNKTKKSSRYSKGRQYSREELNKLIQNVDDIEI